MNFHPTPIGRPEENWLVVRCKLNCIQMGGESTLVMFKERERVYRANSKLKHFRNEICMRSSETTSGPSAVPFAHVAASNIF